MVNSIFIGDIINDISDFIPIKDFETYAINKKGEVLDLRNKKLMKQYPNINGGGYLQLQLINEKGYISHRIHRLVAETFIPLIKGKIQVDHIDRNILNNNVDNLRWVDVYEQNENKGVQEKSKTQRKYIYLEDVKTKRNPNKSWKITIKNSKCKYNKRYDYATYTIDDVVKIRNEVLKEHNIPIID
jgi:hypothetical protein